MSDRSIVGAQQPILSMRLLALLALQGCLLLRSATDASALEVGPLPTSADHDNDSIDTGISPRPTPGPALRAVSDALLLPQLHGGLVKRDGEDWVCGYESAVSCKP